MIWIGIDAHKRVHQALALSADGVLGQKTITNTAVGRTELLRWASPWSERISAVEGSGSLGRGVAQFLAVRGERGMKSIRAGPPDADVDCVDPEKAMCSTHRQLHDCCEKKVKACHWSKPRPWPVPACNCGAACATMWSWI